MVYGLKAISHKIELITNLNWLFNYTFCYKPFLNIKIMTLKKIKWKLTHRTVCDSCGKVNPKLLRENSRYTKCCAYDDKNSNGKTWVEKLKFPIVIKWEGFWRS